MERDRDQRIRDVVFERLSSGATRPELLAELRARLDEEAAQSILDEAVARLARVYGQEDQRRELQRARKRRVSSEYVAWKIVAGFFLVAGLGSVLAVTLFRAPTGSMGGLLIGGVIMLVIDWRVSRRVTAAEEGINRLLGIDAEASMEVTP